MSLIDTKALETELENALYMTDSTKAAVRAIIRKVPTVDAAPVVHGRWEDMGDFCRCSACNATRLKEINTHYGKAVWVKTMYCADCGAKMDRGGDGKV